jgi:hypothetical protein
MTRIRTNTRTLANGAPGKSLYLLYDPATGAHLAAESRAECDGLIELMYDRDIAALVVQPERFQVPDVDGEFHYTPDVRYVRRDGRIGFREFKSAPADLSEADRIRYLTASNHLRSLGYEYSLVYAEELRKGHRLANIKLLFRYSACELDTALLSWLNKRLPSRPGSYDIGTFRSQAGVARTPNLFKLLWQHAVAVDIDTAPLTDESLLWRARP